jgi:hypothetical protein
MASTCEASRPRHEFVGIVDALPAPDAQRERECVGNIFGYRG